MLFRKSETATTAVSFQVENCFSPGGPLGGYSGYGGKSKILRNDTLQ